MNYEKEKKEAMKYAKKGGAYVKATYDDKGKNELLVSGDMIALMRIAERIISRIGDISEKGFVETWLAVKDLHNMTGDEEVVERGQKVPYEVEQ